MSVQTYSTSPGRRASVPAPAPKRRKPTQPKGIIAAAMKTAPRKPDRRN